MWRCCGKSPDDEGFDPLPVMFPMWVLPVQAFLSMTGPPRCFQQLMEEKLLVKWTAGMYCIFLSHQWLSNTMPDPRDEQISVFREALLKILSGEVRVQSDLSYLAVFQRVEQLSPAEVDRLRTGYIWLDWFSIPQITMSREGDADVSADVQAAIASIPAYVDAADLFAVVCPPARRLETQEFYDHHTWARRGWCLVELAAATMSRKSTTRLLFVNSKTHVSFVFPSYYLTSMPGQGEFTADSDCVPLYSVMEQIVDSRIEQLWAKGARAHVPARLLTAMRGRFLGNLGTLEQRQQRHAEQWDDPEAFLERFRFSSLHPVEASGVGPMMCAALAGNLQMLKHLASANADVNQRVTRAGECPEVLLVEGTTPFVAAAFFNPDPAVVRCLAELRADLHMGNKRGHSAMFGAAAAGSVPVMQELLDLGLSVAESLPSFGESPLTTAACSGQAGTLSLLLERRAEVDGRTPLGVTPLIFASMFGKMECCRLLLEHRADVNAVATPTNSYGRALTFLFSAASLVLPSEGPAWLLVSMAGSSAVQIAAMAGHSQVVQLLLEAKADVSRIRDGPSLDLVQGLTQSPPLAPVELQV